MSRDPRWGYGPTYFRNLLDDEELTGRYDSGTLKAQDDVGRWLRSHYRHIHHCHCDEGRKEDLRKPSAFNLVELDPEDFDNHGAYLHARLTTPHGHLGGPLSSIKRNWAPDEAVNEDEWKEIHSHEAFPQSKKHSEGQIIRIQVPHLMPDGSLGIQVHGTTVTKIIHRHAKECGWLTGDQILRINGRVVANGTEFHEHADNAMEVHRITSRPIMFDVWRHPQRQPRGAAPQTPQPAPHHPPQQMPPHHQPVRPQTRPQLPQQPQQAYIPHSQPPFPGPGHPPGQMPVPQTSRVPHPQHFPGPPRVPSPVASPVASYVPPPFGPVSPVASHVPMAMATITTGPGGLPSPAASHVPMPPQSVHMATATIHGAQGPPGGLVCPSASHVPMAMAVPPPASCVPMASASIHTGVRPSFPAMPMPPAHGRTASPVASPRASFVAYPPSHGQPPQPMQAMQPMLAAPWPQHGGYTQAAMLPSTPSVYMPPGGMAPRYRG
mmetsp:Transcript_22819/g.52187  ORF Transcript_22819/g.52187 Transcript_22819/m.52187 type:complete len:492 (+) Transcript_22819:76-1551(+)